MIAQQAESVGQILHAYIDIHNDVFGGGLVRLLRRLLPIPGLFQAIDFAGHSRSLGILSIQLEAIQSEIGADEGSSQLAALLRAYAEALLQTIRELYRICRQLDTRRDTPRAYTADQYRDDLKQYQASVARYQVLGDQLNRALRAPLS